MSFRVSTNGAGADEMITLENTSNGTKASIYAFGALLNSFSVNHNDANTNVIYGFQNPADAQKNITPLFQSAKLSPFVCRMKEGHYTFANGKHKIEKYYNGREAIHGLIYDAVFTVQETGEGEDSAFVTLTFDYDKTDAGYPFFYRASITYSLQSNNRLTLVTRITNLSEVSIPMSDGWHPYFCLNKKVDELSLFMNTNEMVEFDQKLLPTGTFLPYKNFTRPQQIKDTALDNCFVVKDFDAQPACILSDEMAGLQVNIYPEKSYPFLQVFIPHHRDCIAIENLSSLPDSFNNAVGLIILEPSQSHQFVTTYQVQQITTS